MKRPTVFLTLSLAANAALVLTFFLRPDPGSPKIPATEIPSASAAADGAASQMKLAAAFASGDPDALRAAGVPLEVVLRLTAANAFAKLWALDRAQQPPASAVKKYWRNTPTDPAARTKATPEQEAAGKKAQREFDEAMHAAFGTDDLLASTHRYDFLRDSTRKQLNRIVEDYDELRSQVRRDVDPVVLPSDDAKFKLLNQEQERDMMAAMTPEERMQYELHTAATADHVRNQWGDAIQTEDDYKQVFTLQKAFDAQFPSDPYADGSRPSEDLLRAREAATRQLDDDVRAVVGDESYTAFRRTSDEEYQTLKALATRLALPASAADQAYATRETYASRSMQINADPTLSAGQRSHQISALAEQAKTDLAAQLGPEGARAFVQSSAAWIDMLSEGYAFSPNRKDSAATYNGPDAAIYRVPRKN